MKAWFEGSCTALRGPVRDIRSLSNLTEGRDVMVERNMSLVSASPKAIRSSLSCAANFALPRREKFPRSARRMMQGLLSIFLLKHHHRLAANRKVYISRRSPLPSSIYPHLPPSASPPKPRQAEAAQPPLEPQRRRRQSTMACPVNHPAFHALVFLIGVLIMLSRYIKP